MTYSKAQIEEYRDVNVDCGDWYEYTIEYWKELLKKFGIACDEINFSGFWSQGDGASFTGWVENDARFITFMTGGTKSYPLWRELATRYRELNIKITRDCSRYVHEYSTSVEVETDCFAQYTYPDGTELIEAVHRVWDRTIDSEMRQFELDCRDFVRALNRYIYKDLEREYEYLTSDEAVIEWMENNGIMPEDEQACAA